MGLTLAIKMRVPAMYYSADSDSFDQVRRAYQILTGATKAEAEAFALGQSNRQSDSLSNIPVRFNWEAAPSLDNIEQEIAAFDELYGEYPHLVVVDNIRNVQWAGINQDDEGSLEGLMEYFKTMARTTQACLIGLHHVTGKYNDGVEPIPLSGVKGQISAVPEMVLTHHRPDDFTLAVSGVKVRGSRSDPSGCTFAALEFDGDTMQLRDFHRPVLATERNERRERGEETHDL